MSILLILAGFIVITYLLYYITSRKYLETFLSNKSEKQVKNEMKESFEQPDRPYATSAINDVDDYEYSAVFQNEGNREASDAEINMAMSRHITDWTTQPPSSQYFQSQREAFIEARKQDMANPTKIEGFEQINGDNMIPPDLDAIDEEERKILQTYKPEKTTDLLKYDIQDAKTLVQKIYESKGLVATVEKSKQGQNVFEITEVHKKNEPIIWEEDAEEDAMKLRDNIVGESKIEVPPTVNDMAAGLDPFFEPRGQTRLGRNDYTKWTPGLERMFAPTYETQQWY
jgi:hypothetical protein